MVALVVLVGATQAVKFPTGLFTGNDGTNNIALQFDSTGTLTAYVNDQAFSNGTYTSSADTVRFGPVNGPEGYSCAGDATYLWRLTESRLAFTMLADDCEVRSTTLTSLTWTRGS
jgi:hypothetical protein